MARITVLSPLFDTSQVEATLCKIAEAFDGQEIHLVGLYVKDIMDYSLGYAGYSTHGYAFPADVIEDLSAQSKEATARVKAAFEACSLPHTVVKEWRAVTGNAFDHISTQALYADLTVLPSQPNMDHAFYDELLALHVSDQAPTPVLLLPLEAKIKPVFSKPVLAWKESPEAARAARSLMRLVPSGGEIDVAFAYNQFNDDGISQPSAADMCAYLARQGYQVTDSLVHTANSTIGQALVEHANDKDASVIVAGGYGRRRWVEVVFGGVTQTLVGQDQIPVLLAR